MWPLPFATKNSAFSESSTHCRDFEIHSARCAVALPKSPKFCVSATTTIKGTSRGNVAKSHSFVVSAPWRSWRTTSGPCELPSSRRRSRSIRSSAVRRSRRASSNPAGGVSRIATPRTCSGKRLAYRSTWRPPIECPTRTTDPSTPRVVSNSCISLAIRVGVRGWKPGSLRPSPGRSKVTTRAVSDNSGTRPLHVPEACPAPAARTTVAGPSPETHTLIPRPSTGTLRQFS